MKYIKQEDNVTKTFEVEFDMERIKELIALLDRDCYVRRVGEQMVPAKFRNEAEETIKGMVNKAGLPVNEVYKLGELTKGPFWYHGLPLDANYQAIYKDSVGLVKNLNFIFENQNDPFFYDYCVKALEEINDYGNSIDFVPFNARVEVANDKLDEQLKNKDENILDNIKEYAFAVVEAKLNPNYNFQRLAELYMEVLKCIKYRLVEETIRYTK